jgi:hypothetical protein
LVLRTAPVPAESYVRIECAWRLETATDVLAASEDSRKVLATHVHQRETLTTKDFGLVPDVALYGSEDWWARSLSETGTLKGQFHMAFAVVQNAVEGAQAGGVVGGVAGAANTLNPLYAIAVAGLETKAGIATGNYERAAGAATTAVLVIAAAIVGGRGGAAEGAEAGAGRAAILDGSQVTEGLIRDAMKDAPLQSQQPGGVSLPLVQRYVDRPLAGETPPAIKVDGKIIVDGNHRYIAGRIVGQDPPTQPWLGGNPSNVIPWDTLPVFPNEW